MTMPPTPSGLPDLRSLIPPGVPPPPDPLPYRADDAGRRQFEHVTQVRSRMLAEGRRMQLPPYVWVMSTYSSPILLRVLAPRVVEICRGIDQPTEILHVAHVLRAGVRGSHLRLQDAGGKRHRMSVQDPGALGPADVATYPSTGTVSDPTKPFLVDMWQELRDAVLGFAMIPVLIALALWRTPGAIARARRRRRERNRIIALIQG